MEKENFEELKFSKFFYKNANSALRSCKVIYKEYQLYPALRVMQKRSGTPETRELKPFGRIDFVISYKGTKYVVEIKYNEGSHTSFWDALKVIGYTKYYAFQTGDTKAKPAIFMPKDSIKLEHEFICSELGIKLFSITEVLDHKCYGIHGYTLKEIGNVPIW